MSGDRAFFDTNVLLCMYGGDTSKVVRAKSLFRQYAQRGGLMLSTHVVQEFYMAGSRKLAMPYGILHEAAARMLDLPIVIIGPPHVRSAMDYEDRYRISFRDGLVLAAAESSGVEVVFSEDLMDGQQYGKVMVRNPFHFPVEIPKN